MSPSTTSFCRGSLSRWDLFCNTAQIFQSDNVDDLLLEPVILPKNLPALIEAALSACPERYRHRASISTNEFTDICLDEDSVQVVAVDSMNFERHMPHLCRLYNRFKVALARNTSEAAIRRAIDDLFELVFETDPQALVNSSYHVETKVRVVKYDSNQLPSGPTAVATSDGAVVIPMPRQLKQTLKAGGVVYAGPDLEAYILSFVEFKGGLSNNGRQAILNSAAIQAVNRALGLGNMKNYSFSVRHAQVDTITSWWEPGGAKDFRYCYSRQNNKFTLDAPIGWFSFFSFLCRLRRHHHSVRDALAAAFPATLLTTKELFHAAKREHMKTDNSRPGGTRADEELEDEIALGEEATDREVSADTFCQSEDCEEDFEDEDDDANHDGAKDKVLGWIADVVIVDVLDQYPDYVRNGGNTMGGRGQESGHASG